jgi:hypothetical protein
MGGHVARNGEMRGPCKILIRKTERKSLIERPRIKLEDNIKLVFQEIDWRYGVD